MIFRRLKYFKKLIYPILLFLLLIAFSSAGFMLIEHYNVIQALYMTMITLATVGFTEVKPLSDAGREFTMLIIFINLIAFTYFVTMLTRYLLDGEFMRQYKKMTMDTAIGKLRNHVIICGFGRNGRQCTQVLHTNKIPYVILEEKIDIPDDLPFEVSHFVRGDATKDQVLLDAGIMHARAIVASLPIDADNLFIVLTARQLNPNIKIISRASNDSSIPKLKIAGANHVIMPDKLGGANMATLVLNPDVIEILSMISTKSNEEFRVSELEVRKDQDLETLNLWQKTGATVLGVKNADEFILNPSPAYYLHAGERIIIMGALAQIEKAKELL